MTVSAKRWRKIGFVPLTKPLSVCVISHDVKMQLKLSFIWKNLIEILNLKKSLQKKFTMSQNSDTKKVKKKSNKFLIFLWDK